MEHIAFVEGKTQLPALLERVAHGEGFLITRRGKPAAHLLPVNGPVTDARTAVANVQNFGRLHRGRLHAKEIREYLNDGRRH